MDGSASPPASPPDGVAARIPAAITLSPPQRRILEEFVARRRSAQGLAKRARIVLLAAEGRGRKAIADEVGVDLKTVALWRRRWADAAARWSRDGGDWDEEVWRCKAEETLRDAPRSGAPCTFQPEQVCRIIALACRKPADFGIPVSHWSAADLRREVVRQAVVTDISARQVGRFLKRRTCGRTACATT